MPDQSKTCYSKPYPSYPCHKCEYYVGNMSRALESNTKSPPAKLCLNLSAINIPVPAMKSQSAGLWCLIWTQTHSKSYSPKYLSSGPWPDRESLDMVSAYKL